MVSLPDPSLSVAVNVMVTVEPPQWDGMYMRGVQTMFCVVPISTLLALIPVIRQLYVTASPISGSTTSAVMMSGSEAWTPLPLKGDRIVTIGGVLGPGFCAVMFTVRGALGVPTPSVTMRVSVRGPG